MSSPISNLFKMNKGNIYFFGGADGIGAAIGVDMMNEDFSKGYTIIILSNYDFPVVMNMYEKIKKMIYSFIKNG